MNQAVVARKISFAYIGANRIPVPVLRGLTLNLNYGQIVGLVGRNGSGKTTLLQVLCGRLKPQTGDVAVGSTTVVRSGRLVTRPRLAVISQRPDSSLAPTMSVYENYILASRTSPLNLRWSYSARNVMSCRELLARAGMGLEDKLKEQTRFLSSGQQQALAIMLAMLSDDPILFMDEPTAALDPISAAKILALAIFEIKQKQGCLVLVSHRIRDILEVCNRILILRNGVITQDISSDVHAVTEKELLGFIAGQDAALGTEIR